MRAKSNKPYVITAFDGRHYPPSEWRLVPVGCEEEARRNPYLLLEDDEPLLAVELEDMDEAALRELAKSKGVTSYWNKKPATLIAELRED